MKDLQAADWYAVRCVFALTGLSDVGETTYEERVTLWQARSSDQAIERAEAEAEDYADSLTQATYLGIAQSYKLFDIPGDGVEVFSLMRDSDLAPSDYLDAFFDTGTERQQHTP